MNIRSVCARGALIFALAVAPSAVRGGEMEGIDSGGELLLRLSAKFEVSPDEIRVSRSGALLLWGRTQSGANRSYSIEDGAIGLTSDLHFVDRNGELFSQSSSQHFIRYTLFADRYDDGALVDATLDFYSAVAAVGAVAVAARAGAGAFSKTLLTETTTLAVPEVGWVRLGFARWKTFRNIGLAEDIARGLRTYRGTTFLTAENASRIPNGRYNYVIERVGGTVEFRVAPDSIHHSQIATRIDSDSVIGAGVLDFKDTKVIWLNNTSGHYFPEERTLVLARSLLERARLVARDMEVSPFRSIAEWRKWVEGELAKRALHPSLGSQ